MRIPRDRAFHREVRDGFVVLVDAGSTVTHFAQQLAVEGTQATVITNSLGVATALGAGRGAADTAASGKRQGPSGRCPGIGGDGGGRGRAARARADYLIA